MDFLFLPSTLSILVIKQNKPFNPWLGLMQSDIRNWVKPPEGNRLLYCLPFGIAEKSQHFFRNFEGVWAHGRLQTPSDFPDGEDLGYLLPKGTALGLF
jgi:hypothetical protein